MTAPRPTLPSPPCCAREWSTLTPPASGAASSWLTTGNMMAKLTHLMQGKRHRQQHTRRCLNRIHKLPWKVICSYEGMSLYWVFQHLFLCHGTRILIGWQINYHLIGGMNSIGKRSLSTEQKNFKSWAYLLFYNIKCDRNNVVCKEKCQDKFNIKCIGGHSQIFSDI